MRKIHKFGKSIKIGDLGEQDFMKEYGFIKAPTFDYDFHSQRGVKYELKTDQYIVGDRLSYTKKITNNFFMERYIVQENGHTKDGCVWTAYKNANYFIYYFRNSQIFYVFDVKDLEPRLNTAIIAYGLDLSRPVWNDGYYATGYKIPITALLDIAKDFTFGDQPSHTYFTKLDQRGEKNA